MNKSLFGLLFTLLLTATAFAQNRTVHGTVMDSTKMPIAGVTVKLITAPKDTVLTTTNDKGNFQFVHVSTAKVTLTFFAIGYQGLIRHYTLDTGKVTVGNIQLKTDVHVLSGVNIVSVIPVTFREDTIEYKASAYKVRENAPLADLVSKLPGVDVDASGNVTAQGKQVTKVRMNGKDFFNGDVNAAMQNIPADIVENVQMIDDYGDQANLTGVKTGDPTKIMNINIKPSKSHGYTGQATLGDGSDVLPKQPGVQNDNRYLGLLNDFIFNGDEQIALLGNVNNTNVNTFSFGSPTPPPSGGGDMLKVKKAAMDNLQIGGLGGLKLNITGGGGGNFTSQASGINGITDTHAAGFNYRDQWGKHLSVYGSYNFSDNTIFTSNNTLQQNTTLSNPGSISQFSKETDKNINHSIQWNMEYKPNDANYLKVTPIFSYAGSNGTQTAQNVSMRADTINSAYNSVNKSTLNSPAYGFTALFNHRFAKKGRDLSIDVSANLTRNKYYQTPVYNFTAGPASLPDQQVATNSYTNNYSTSISYMEPVGQYSFLQFNYAFNLSKTTSDRQDNVLDTMSHIFYPDSTLSSHYNYTFITNRVGVNFNYARKDKYNYTLGLAVLPAVLDGNIPGSGPIRRETFNVVPTAHFSYTISKNKTFSMNYYGSTVQPTFAVLQPVTDYSNALYPVQGNPDLRPSFTNNLSVQYNFFDFGNSKTLFTNASFSQTQNQVVTNTIIYPANYTPNTLLDNSYFTKYLNANGFYTASGYISFTNPWDKRRYSLSLNGSVRYTNSVGYITNVDPMTYDETTEKNTARTLTVTPGMRFRLDLPDVIDAQFLTNYSINKTFNSIQNSLTNATSNIRAWNLSLSGKNYFHDWTVSYDYSKVFNYGYAESVHATNPNLLNMYMERRFLKGHRATVRLAVFDVFNQNTGFSSNTTASYITQTNTNRLGRYYLASFTLRLQKFGGK